MKSAIADRNDLDRWNDRPLYYTTSQSVKDYNNIRSFTRYPRIILQRQRVPMAEAHTLRPTQHGRREKYSSLGKLILDSYTC